MDEQNIKLPEPIHVKNIHRKLDLFSENNIIKQWSGHNIVDTFFYLYLFNKYKHNCFIRYKTSPEAIVLGLELLIKEKKDSTIEEYNNYEKHLRQIAMQLTNCINKGLPTIIIPLYLKLPNLGHANLLIYRQKNNVIEHFEPHGSRFRTPTKNMKYINKKLDEFISILNTELPQQSQVQLVRANDVCPIFDGFQVLEEKSTIPKLEIQGKGYCAAWSMFFTELSLKNPNYSSNELINIIYDKLNKLSEKDRNNYLRQIIVGYVNLINDKINKYFSIILGKNITTETIAKNLKNIDETYLNFVFSMDTILDIENELLNDPYFTKDDYVQFIKRKIKNTKNSSEKQKLMKQEKMLENKNINLLLTPSPISEPSKSSSEKSISSVDLSNLSSLKSSSKSLSKSKSPSKKTSTSISSVKLNSLSSLKSSPKSGSKFSQKNKSSLTSPLTNSSSLLSSPNSLSKKSSSSLKKSVSSIKSSISSLKKSVNTLEDVSSSIDVTPKSKLSSPKSNSSLKKSVSSIKSSISSLTDSLYSLIDNNSPSPKEKKSRCDEKKLKPCSETQIRNPKTCRCNKIKTGCVNKKLKPCSEIQVRNSITCRCNNINNTRKRKICQPEKFKPCTNNRVRNSVTCRCRKIKL